MASWLESPVPTIFNTNVSWRHKHNPLTPFPWELLVLGVTWPWQKGQPGTVDLNKANWLTSRSNQENLAATKAALKQAEVNNMGAMSQSPAHCLHWWYAIPWRKENGEGGSKHITQPEFTKCQALSHLVLQKIQQSHKVKCLRFFTWDK